MESTGTETADAALEAVVSWANGPGRETPGVQDVTLEGWATVATLAAEATLRELLRLNREAELAAPGGAPTGPELFAALDAAEPAGYVEDTVGHRDRGAA